MYTVSAPDDTDASDGGYIFPSARGSDEAPELLYRTPTGRELIEFRQLQARYQEARQNHIDERRAELEETLDEGDTLEDVARIAVENQEGLKLADELDDEEMDDWLDGELDDPEAQYITTEGAVRMLCAQGFHADLSLRDEYLDWCVEVTVGVSDIYVEEEDGKRELDWSDDSLIREHTLSEEERQNGTETREGRRRLIDGFGAEHWERIRAPFLYATWIEQRESLGSDQKKD